MTDVPNAAVSQRNDTLIAEMELRENLGEKFHGLVRRLEDLLLIGQSWIQVANEEEARAVSDVRKGFQALIKQFDAQR